MTNATETITSETGTVWTITSEISDYNGSVITNIKAENNGRILANGALYLVERNIHPTIKPAILAAVRRTSLAARGTTEEADAARIAAIDACDASYTAIQNAMTLNNTTF